MHVFNYQINDRLRQRGAQILGILAGVDGTTILPLISVDTGTSELTPVSVRHCCKHPGWSYWNPWDWPTSFGFQIWKQSYTISVITSSEPASHKWICRMMRAKILFPLRGEMAKPTLLTFKRYIDPMQSNPTQDRTRRNIWYRLSGTVNYHVRLKNDISKRKCHFEHLLHSRKTLVPLENFPRDWKGYQRTGFPSPSLVVHRGLPVWHFDVVSGLFWSSR